MAAWDMASDADERNADTTDAPRSSQPIEAFNVPDGASLPPCSGLSRCGLEAPSQCQQLRAGRP